MNFYIDFLFIYLLNGFLMFGKGEEKRIFIALRHIPLLYKQPRNDGTAPQRWYGTATRDLSYIFPRINSSIRMLHLCQYAANEYKQLGKGMLFRQCCGWRQRVADSM